MESLFLSADSMIAAFALTPLLRSRQVPLLVLAFGVCDSLGSKFALHVVPMPSLLALVLWIMLVAAVLWRFVTPTLARWVVFVFPLLLTLDNVVADGDPIGAGTMSLVMAGIGASASLLIRRSMLA